MAGILEELGERRCFVVYKLAPKAAGKSDKIPIDPMTGYHSDAQSPLSWLTADVARAWAELLGPEYGIGVVLAPDMRVGCVDIDGALLPNGEWSPLAHDLCRRFAGALIEVSVSGTGLHIFFSYRGNCPPHRTRWSAQGACLEFYHEARFIALGTAHAGSVGADCTDAMSWLIETYFTASEASTPVAWTTEPAESWRGPLDDAELIARMLRSKSAGAIFGNKASFADLWNADADKLSIAFPPNPNSATPYDASEADQALCNHLAFWTGGNCERMFLLAWQSKLARSKWERADYLPGTILRSCGWQKTYYVERTRNDAVPLPAHVAVAPDPPAAPTVVSVHIEPVAGAYVTLADQIRLFQGCTYIQDMHQILMPAPISATLNKERFDAKFGGMKFQTTIDANEKCKSAWDCFIMSELYRFDRAHGLYFDPRQEPGARILREGLVYANSWRPIEIVSYPGDVARWLNHLHKLLPRGNDAYILLQFCKFVIQHMGVKASWFPFIQGVEGNGKSFISETMAYCVGERYTHKARASQVSGQFNAAFYGKILITMDDAKLFEDQGMMWEALKPMIDGKRLEIEYKGVDKVTREVCFNFIITSNHKDGLRKTQNDRRIAPFFCAQQQEEDLVRDGLTTDYFVDLWDWAEFRGGWANIHHFLSTDPIDPLYNPAKLCIRAPVTTSTHLAIEASLGAAEQDIKEAIDREVEGFVGGWVSSYALKVLLQSIGKRFLPRTKQREMLATLGYIEHPALKDGRLNNPLPIGGRVVLYVKKESDAARLQDPIVIQSVFQNEQTKAKSAV